jgi:hypothetical protein
MDHFTLIHVFLKLVESFSSSFREISLQLLLLPESRIKVWLKDQITYCKHNTWDLV